MSIMSSSSERLILKPFGGCSDAGLCRKAFDRLGYRAAYSGDPRMVESADLIYLPGGSDVDPSRYGGDPELSWFSSSGMLDRWEVEVIPKALEFEVPIFGVCRGHQSLWVELGGKLEQHISPRHLKIRRPLGGHIVNGDWGDAVVNSLHHQAPDIPVPNGAVVRMVAPDGTIEGFTYGNFAVGVQWHPEMLPHDIWMYLMIAAINREADRIPEVYGQKELSDDYKNTSPYQLNTWSDATTVSGV